MGFRLSLGLPTLVGLMQLVAAADIYVSPTGSDNADGSKGSPFKTLVKAQLAVRSLATPSMREDVTVHLSGGVHSLAAPLVFTSADSGKNGRTVHWTADGTDTTVSGGIKLTGWTAGQNGVWSAAVPAGTKSRNLYVRGQASNYARRKIANRKEFTYNANGMSWSDGKYDWLQSTEGLAGAEVRFISSFTDRYAPIESVGQRQLVMRKPSWTNNIMGYDTLNNPNADFGVWVQGARALLTEGGQFYLDSAAGRVYYKPLREEEGSMSSIDAYLGVLEVLVAVSGKYGDPAHDIRFSGINFAHSTWLAPSTIGYVDQQTGGHIAEQKTYPNFEAARPGWHQMPSAVQVSAASNITFVGGSYTQMGGGGVGLGNDANAHLTGVGLGAQSVSVTDGYFSQIMGNSITAGGVRADAHHPPNAAAMTNSRITIADNVFRNVSALYSSTVPIFVSYVRDSAVRHNDIFQAPYSGICHGYGWGSNDAGGSPEYVKRGLYNYQPQYSTPTVSQNNRIEANLLRQYGLSHTDLGALYTLSKSPGSSVDENYAYDSNGFGVYNDEGSNSYAVRRNVLLCTGIWRATNGANTGNNAFADNWGRVGSVSGSDRSASNLQQTSAAAQRVAYRAGVRPSKRAGRSVSNDPGVADGYLGSSCSGSGDLTLTLWNYDDSPFTGVSFAVRTNNGAQVLPSGGASPATVGADTWVQAKFRVASGGCGAVAGSSASYTNSRTGAKATRNGVNATPPSGSPPAPGTGGAGGIV
ncbi:hypothetical protein RB597_007690 [Gaeumannomyces tritici]